MAIYSFPRRLEIQLTISLRQTTTNDIKFHEMFHVVHVA